MKKMKMKDKSMRNPKKMRGITANGKNQSGGGSSKGSRKGSMKY